MAKKRKVTLGPANYVYRYGETSVDYINSYLTGLQTTLEKIRRVRNSGKGFDVSSLLGTYQIGLKSIQLALGKQGNIGGLNEAIRYLGEMQQGQYDKAQTVSEALKKATPEVLDKVRISTEKDKGLIGRTDPSRVKRRLYNERALMSERKEYGTREYKERVA